MIVFLPIKITSTGGTSSFAKKLQAGLAEHGHHVIFDYQKEYDVLLASPAAPWPYLLDAKRRGKKILHRLDGVYYPTTTAGWLYPLYNARLALIRHFFVNTTVYQSQYSKKCCDTFLGKTNKPAITIYNGVDTDLFSPQGLKANLRDTPDQHVFITASRFRRTDQIIPLISTFQTYRQKYYSKSKLVILGNFVGSVKDMPKRYADDPSIHFLGIIPNEQLPQYLRAADIFLFTHLNPPCPNNVIEAMACGLPVCGIADGAMPELITSGLEGELLPTQGDAFYKPRSYTTALLAANSDHIMQNRAAYATAARKRAERDFTLDYMVDAYINIFIR